MKTLAVVIMITLHAPNGDVISINPQAVTAMRRNAPQHEGGIECFISMNDGKDVAVVEHCEKVQELMKAVTGG